MTAKRYTKQIDRVADTIINIQKDGKDFAWFLLDDYTNDEVDKVIEELNQLHEKNQRLRNDNLTLFALLGDIRALLRTGDVTECIEKINRLEKEMQQ